MNFLNTVIKILHILACGSIVTLLIKEIVDTREAKKARELLKDVQKKLFFEALALTVIETKLEEMKESTQDNLMKVYEEDLLKDLDMLGRDSKLIREQLEDYLE